MSMPDFVESIVLDPNNLIVGGYAIIESQGRYYPVHRYTLPYESLTPHDTLQAAVDACIDKLLRKSIPSFTDQQEVADAQR